MTDEFRDELPTSSIAEVLVYLRETSDLAGKSLQRIHANPLRKPSAHRTRR